MKTNSEYKLFEPSGCLSHEGLSLFARGKLNAQEVSAVKIHLQSCEFCTLAVEGMDMVKPDEFEDDLKIIFATLGEENETIPEEEMIPEFAESIEGPRFPRLSDAEMQQFRENMLKKAARNQEVKKLSETKRSIFKRYRLEMIAAVVLLFLAIGARQIFVGLSPEKQTMELAQAPVKPEDEDKADVIEQQITERKSLLEEKAEINPMPPKTVQKAEIQVEGEVSDDFIIDYDDSKISLTQEQKGEEPELKGEASFEKKQDIPKEALNQATIPYSPRVSKTDTSGEDANLAEGAVSVLDINRLDAKLDYIAAEDVEIMEAMEEETAETEVFVIVEQAPEFPGGEKKRLEFLKENLNYPEEAQKAGFQGTVYITFVVEKDGKISDVRVLRGIGAGCDEEALRVIRLMPKWKPGTQRGKPVRVQMNLPITFSLLQKK